jgi:hypothetical protein
MQCKVERDYIFKPTICNKSLYEISNNNWIRNKMYHFKKAYIQDYNNAPTTRHVRVHTHIHRTEILKGRR